MSNEKQIEIFESAIHTTGKLAIELTEKLNKHGITPRMQERTALGITELLKNQILILGYINRELKGKEELDKELEVCGTCRYVIMMGKSKKCNTCKPPNSNWSSDLNRNSIQEQGKIKLFDLLTINHITVLAYHIVRDLKLINISDEFDSNQLEEKKKEIIKKTIKNWIKEFDKENN